MSPNANKVAPISPPTLRYAMHPIERRIPLNIAFLNVSKLSFKFMRQIYEKNIRKANYKQIKKITSELFIYKGANVKRLPILKVACLVGLAKITSR